MEKAKEYQLRAEECLRLAGTAPSPELRATYSELAKTWAKMAGERVDIIIPMNERKDAETA